MSSERADIDATDDLRDAEHTRDLWVARELTFWKRVSIGKGWIMGGKLGVDWVTSTAEWQAHLRNHRY